MWLVWLHAKITGRFGSPRFSSPRTSSFTKTQARGRIHVARLMRRRNQEIGQRFQDGNAMALGAEDSALGAGACLAEAESEGGCSVLGAEPVEPDAPVEPTSARRSAIV